VPACLVSRFLARISTLGTQQRAESCGPVEGSSTISSGWHVCGTSRRATRNLREIPDGISRAPVEPGHPLGEYGTDLAPLLSPASGGTTSTGIKQHKQRASRGASAGRARPPIARGAPRKNELCQRARRAPGASAPPGGPGGSFY